jgi:predicted amidohydrolase
MKRRKRRAPMKTVAAVQFDIAWEDKRANFSTVRRLLERAALPQNTLVALPEMFATGFSMKVDAVAEPYEGETEQFLGQLANDFGVFLVAGAAMRGKDGKARNKALVFSPEGKLIGWYAKMRPFTPGGEKDFYAPGKAVTSFRWDECMVSPFVCYDLRFPELFRNAAKEQRPELFVVIANFPEKRIQHWIRLIQARAIENQAYVLAVNRIGKDPYYEYPGRSLIVDPDGEIIADAGSEEGCITAELDLVKLKKYRSGLPFLEDM